MDSKSWAVYIVQTENLTLYTGITTDVERRFAEHLDIFNGKPSAKGAKYFRRSKPDKVVLVEQYPNRSEASKREAMIKKMTKAQKKKLIAEGSAIMALTATSKANTPSDSAPSDIVAPSDFALDLLNGRHVASLATQRADGSIHLTAIWYLYQDGLLYFPTSSSSQKVRNVERSTTVSAMIDTTVPGREQGVSVSGHATVIRGDEGRALVAEAQRRYLTPKALDDPKIGPAYTEFDDVVIALTPQRWTTWNIADMNEETFGGVLGVDSGYLYPLDE